MMKLKLIVASLVIVTAVGCKSQKMNTVSNDSSRQPLIEKETDIQVNVDHQTGIMSLEESFTFDQESDRNKLNEKSFFVIMGSFREKSNAENFTRELKSKGFEPAILLSESGLHRISVAGYDIENDARTRIVEIRTRFPEHGDTWLLIRK